MRIRNQERVQLTLSTLCRSVSNILKEKKYLFFLRAREGKTLSYVKTLLLIIDYNKYYVKHQNIRPYTNLRANIFNETDKY